MPDAGLRRTRSRVAVWLAGLVGIAAIGAVDYLSGTELRVYPLYYGPIGLLAWYAGRVGAFGGALLSATSWLCFNMLEGMRFFHGATWAANMAVHATSFLFVGLLVATLRRALASTRELSQTDQLTLLRNSRGFYEDAVLLLSLCRRTRRPLTVAYVDLDNFKAINDTHGHQAGDALLREVAGAIRTSVRPSDLCARLGGDEFAVLLPELREQEAAVALERIRITVNAAVGPASGVTASIGAATFLVAPNDVGTLIRRADTVMYAAKARGGNRVALEGVSASAGAASRPPSRVEPGP